MNAVLSRTSRKWIEFTLAGSCPVLCRYCPQSSLARNYFGDPFMSPAVFSACVSNVPRDFEVHFSGFAEPWLNPFATSFLREVSLEGRAIRVYTTLMGMTVDDVQALIDCRTLTRLCVHTVDSSGMMRLSPTDDYYRHIAMLTDGFRDRPELLQLMVIGEPDPGVLETADRGGFKLRTSTVRETVSRAGNMRRSNTSARVTGPIVCSRQRSLHNNVVLPNGDVVLCCCDYSLQHKLGNLCTHSYREIYRDNISSVLRMQADADSELICRNCEWAATNE